MRMIFAEAKQAAMANALRSCRLFAGLSPESLNAIAAITLPKCIDKGAYLFHEGDPCHGFYVVQRGAINLHRMHAAGKEQIIQILRAGESFAEGSVATESGYPADARALESSQVLLVPKLEILALLRRQPDLALRMLGSVSAHLQVMVRQLEDLRVNNVQTRLANWLMKRCVSTATDRPTRIDLTMPKRVLAAELGTVSETFSRTLAKFRQQGLIEVAGKSVVVLSPARLCELLRKSQCA